MSSFVWRPTWKSCGPGPLLWGNSGRNMEMKLGRLHSALSLSGPTPARRSTWSGMSGALVWSILRGPRRRAVGARWHSPPGRDRPTPERKPRHPEELCWSSLGPWRGAGENGSVSLAVQLVLGGIPAAHYKRCSVGLKN